MILHRCRHPSGSLLSLCQLPPSFNETMILDPSDTSVMGRDARENGVSTGLQPNHSRGSPQPLQQGGALENSPSVARWHMHASPLSPPFCPCLFPSQEDWNFLAAIRYHSRRPSLQRPRSSHSSCGRLCTHSPRSILWMQSRFTRRPRQHSALALVWLLQSCHSPCYLSLFPSLLFIPSSPFPK